MDCDGKRKETYPEKRTQKQQERLCGMKINGVNSGAEALFQNTVNKDGQGTAAYTVGQVITGTVTDVAEQVSLDFGDRKISFPKESVPNAEPGQVRRYQVMDAGAKGISLKEITQEASVSKNGKATPGVLVMDNTQKLLEQEEKVEEKEDEEDPEEVTKELTKEDYSALETEGFTLEDFNMERLARAIERIKNDRMQKAEMTLEQQEKQMKQRAQIEKIARQGHFTNAAAEHLAEVLVQADVRVTDAKIAEMMNAVNLGVQAVQSIHDGAKAYLIGNELAPSIENLYRAEHSGFAKNVPLTDEVWKELKPYADKIMDEIQPEDREAATVNAKWLVQNDLPLTAENLIYKETLDQLAMNADVNSIIDCASEAMSRGQKPEEALLAAEPEQSIANQAVKKAQKTLEEIKPEAVNEAVKRLEAGNSVHISDRKFAENELSLSFLQKVQQELDQSGVQAVSGTQIADITVRRQLEEIRLKLTVESGAKLYRQGISVDTDGLTRVVEGLRNIEKEYYRNLYAENGGVTGEEAKVDLLQQTDTAIRELREAPANVLGVTFASRRSVTLTTLQETGNRLSVQFKQAEERYEALMTKPRSDMGDSIRTAFRNVDSLLQDMGEEITDASRRAVRILSYNHMELTSENLSEMKEYDAQMQDLLNNMNPAACAAMIRKGINPMNMPLPELSRTLNEIRTTEGADTEEKYSNFLVKLDQKHELTEEQRQAYIGVYRLLNLVAKGDRAAVGAVANSGREMTLNNLLSAVRTSRHGKVDASVNDSLGGLQELNLRGTSISEQIEGAFTYEQTVASRIMDGITPEAIAQAADSEVNSENAEMISENAGTNGSANTVNMSLEQLAARVSAADVSEENEIYAQMKTERVLEATGNSRTEQAFLAAYQQEMTVNSLQAAKELLSNRSVKNSLNGIAERYHNEERLPDFDTENIENAEKMRTEVEKWSTSADKMIESLFENTALTGTDSLQLLTLRHTVELGRNLAGREFYEIPLDSETGFVKVNLTVQHSGAQKGSVSIRMKGNEGEVTVDLQAENKRVNCYMTGDAGQEVLTAQGEKMQAALTEYGFEITQWNYGLRTRSVDFAAVMGGVSAQEVRGGNAGSETTRTEDLYLAAKILIQTVQKGQVQV